MYAAGYTGKVWGPGTQAPDRQRNPAGNAYNDIKRPVRERGFSDIDYPANFKKFLDAKPADQPFWFWVGIVEPHTPLDPENDFHLLTHGNAVTVTPVTLRQTDMALVEALDGKLGLEG